MPLFSVCTITLTVTELPVDVLLTFEALKDFHFLQASAVLMSLLEQAMLFRLDVFFLSLLLLPRTLSLEDCSSHYL